MKVFLVFLAGGFAIWGIGDVSTGLFGPGDKAIKAGSQSVSSLEVAQEFDFIRRAQYNGISTGDAIQFFQPRIDLVDGNEPSITDLLGIVPRTDYVLSGVPTMSEGGSSVTGVAACPHPQPFWYGETVTSATAARSYLWGDSTTSTIETVCDDHFQWDTSGKLYVSSTGVYEVDCMFVVYAASDHEMETSIEVDGVTQNATQKNHFHNYKNEYHIRWVGKISAGSYISARNKDVAVVISSKTLPGSTMIVKRLA